MPPTYIYGQISLDFKLKGGVAKATFRYKYFAKDATLEYVDVEYSDPRLQDMIDGNEQIKERIGNYIRSLVAKKSG